MGRTSARGKQTFLSYPIRTVDGMVANPPAEVAGEGRRRAYAYLLGQYLGDGCMSEQRRQVFRMRVTCATAWPLIIDLVGQSMKILLPMNTVGHLDREGCIEVGMSSKRWTSLFPQHGRGPKHLRKLELAGWQREIVFEAHPDLFVCGLLHSDGCRSINKVTVRGKRYAYPRYFFSNRSEDIHAMFAAALDRLAITSTRSWWNQSVAKRGDVETLDRIGASKSRPCALEVPGAGIEPARS